MGSWEGNSEEYRGERVFFTLGGWRNSRRSVRCTEEENEGDFGVRARDVPSDFSVGVAPMATAGC